MSSVYSVTNVAGQDQGALLNGAHAYRGLFAHSGATTIEDLKIEHAVAHGGAGGAGLGGDHPGFAEMLERLLSNGARTIIVESPAPPPPPPGRPFNPKSVAAMLAS